LAEAVKKNVASDGSVLIPQSIPVFTEAELKSLKGACLQKVAELVLKKYFSDDLTDIQIKKVVKKAINFPLPLSQIGHVKVYELFHGPTKSYKDLPSRIFAALTEVLFSDKAAKAIKVLVGSSDYSGSSIAHAFAQAENAQTFCFYPSQMMSEVHSELMNRLGGNATCIEINASAEVCHKLIDTAFNDADLKKMDLLIANTVNIGSLIPHIIYFAYLYAISDKDIQIVMAPGKFGKATAALMAIKMGIPLGKIVLAVDNDDPNAEHFMKTGSYIDRNHSFFDYFTNIKHISVAYDFPRVAYLCNNSSSEFSKHFIITYIRGTRAAQMLSSVYGDYGYSMELRTAAAWVAQDTVERSQKVTPIVIADGSPVLFSKEIARVTNIMIDDGNFIASIKSHDQNNIYKLSAYAEVKSLLQSNA